MTKVNTVCKVSDLRSLRRLLRGRVVGLFSASSITFLKLLGVGMIVALNIDAAVVRVLLVPATMRLLGRANWWAPRPLRRLYARYGIRETEGAEPQPYVPAN